MLGLDSPRVVQEVVGRVQEDVMVEWCLRAVDDVQDLVLVVVVLPVAVEVVVEVLPLTLNLLDWARMPFCWSSWLWTRLIWKPELWLFSTICQGEGTSERRETGGGFTHCQHRKRRPACKSRPMS